MAHSRYFRNVPLNEWMEMYIYRYRYRFFYKHSPLREMKKDFWHFQEALSYSESPN